MKHILWALCCKVYSYFISIFISLIFFIPVRIGIFDSKRHCKICLFTVISDGENQVEKFGSVETVAVKDSLAVGDDLACSECERPACCHRLARSAFRQTSRKYSILLWIDDGEYGVKYVAHVFHLSHPVLNDDIPERRSGSYVLLAMLRRVSVSETFLYKSHGLILTCFIRGSVAGDM